MKISKGVLLVAAFTLSGGALSGGVAAQEVPAPSSEGFRPGWYVAPMLTYMLADSARCGVDDGFGGAVAFGNRGDFASLELWGQFVSLPYDCRYTTPDPDPAPPDQPVNVIEAGDVKLNGGGITLIAGPFFEQRILARFFGIIGFGVIQRQDHPQLAESDSTIFGDAGLGYMHPLELFGYDLNLRAEARYRYDVQQPPRPAGTPAQFEDIIINLGLQIPLFRGEPVAETTAEPVAVVPAAYGDADNDGVIDERDQCPDTPANSLVNNVGCTPEAVPAPAPVSTAPAFDTSEQPTLETAKAGDIIVLSGVTFEFNRAVLQSNARIILDGVAKQLLARPELKIEIGGHTDSKGSETYNQRLSDQRAESVKVYLEQQGVETQRLSSQGYGESQPVDSNETDAGRERNRRVEMKVLE